MKKLILVTVISASLMACNSDDSSSEQSALPQGVEGSIELVDLNTNSVTVNGHSYPVTGAIYNQTPVAINQLQKGMTVNITAPANTVKAGTTATSSATDNSQVRLNPTLVGVVTARTGDAFTINGINLNFTGLATDIEVNDWVMVSSLPAADGGYTVLSVVEFEDPDLIGQGEIEGSISGLTATEFFLAGNIKIDYSIATIDDNEQLSNGQWVEVKGTWNATDAVFNATEIDIEDYDDLADDNEIEGIITWVANDLSSFELNSRGRFLINNQTEFDDGNRDNLIAGQMIEVTSISQGDERLATEIEFDELDSDDWDKFEFDLEGSVTATEHDASGGFSFTINGKTIYTDAKTSYDDGLTADNLDGANVEVEGIIIGSIDGNGGDFVAREIELDDENSVIR